jgi:hypothetical protein
MQKTAKRLEDCKNLNEIFEIVKSAVEKSLGKHRAGLTLVLAELPNYVGAYHIMGSNIIVMNGTILNAVKALAKSKAEFNSFIFSILAHEYLHSIGYTDERSVRPLVRKISGENFGEEHQTVKLASADLFTLYPDLKMLGLGRTGKDFTIVKEFDKSSMPYIG